MTRLLIATARIAIAALFLFSQIHMLHDQTIDPTADSEAVGKVMHDYFAAYSRGDMAAVMKFINVLFVAQGPKGFVTFTKADEALDW
jgi:hypothetical protein